MTTTNVQPGSEVAIKRASQGRFQFYGYRYTFTTVTRVTKARIFVGDVEYDRATLRERPDGHYATQLVVDPAELQKIREGIATEKARSEREGEAIKALEFVKTRFDMFHGRHAAQHRTEAEIQLLIEFAAKLEALKAEQE